MTLCASRDGECHICGEPSIHRVDLACEDCGLKSVPLCGEPACFEAHRNNRTIKPPQGLDRIFSTDYQHQHPHLTVPGWTE